MNQIPTVQNSSSFQRLMRARSRVYQLARRYQVAQLITVLLVPVLGAVVGLACPSSRAYVAALALLATFLDVLWLDRIQRTQLKLAARIQEKFDCELFGLPWNEFVAGKVPDVMTITEADRAWTRPETKVPLLDWHKPSELGEAPLYIARLICQQANIWYDSRLRRRIGAILVAVAVLLAIGLAAVGIWRGLPFTDFVLIVVAPAAPVLTWTMREFYRQRDTAEALETIKANAEALWQKARHGDCEEEECSRRAREFQDAIFTRRATSPLNLPLIYWLMRNKMEGTMEAANRQMLAEAAHLWAP